MINHRKLAAFCSIIIAASIAGCSESREAENGLHTAANMSMQPIQVELDWSPGQVSAGQQVTFEALVTQDGEPVDDAKEVLFEIVNDNNKSRKFEFRGKSAGDGTYRAEGRIDGEGEYTVTSHVTARTQHSMPSKKLVVQP
ncbi:FixH family protein [Paenibacillus sp. S150]|uniref:FixH family protein n=1 Tax=Paenibacillus sp. S150 TaxID=2749826 RepID=UPI001C56794E|nr:FixH family protein [Paenibacillus sp. S150]MBW4080426.1 FixH family protein [Paenibacillus sp. S150]